jgi:hypothetical protein
MLFDIILKLIDELGDKTSIELDLPGEKNITIYVSDYKEKELFNIVGAIKALKDGKKVRVFYLGESHKYLTWVHENGKAPYIAEKVDDNELVEWKPNPTVQDLLHECFKIIEVD